MVPLSLILSLGSTRASNDNQVDPECARFFEMTADGPVNLTETDAEVLFDAKRGPALTKARDRLDRRIAGGPAKSLLKAEEKVHAIIDALPRLGLSARGHHVVTSETDEVRFIHGLSPDARWVVRSDFFESHQQLINRTTGKIVVDRRSPDPGFGNVEVSMIFSGDGRSISVRTLDSVEVFSLTDPPRVIESVDLGQVDWDMEYHREGEDPRSVTINPRGEVHYLRRARALVGFFEGPAPVVLRLGPNASYRRQILDPAPSTKFVPVRYDREIDPARLAAYRMEDRPKYRARGLVAPSEKILIAVRSQYRNHRTESFVEIFDVADGRCRRSIPVRGRVSALALSRSEGVLAVALPDRGGVRVFDLKSASTEPRVIIDLENRDARLLAFDDHDRLLVGSADLSRLLKFTLPRLTN